MGLTYKAVTSVPRCLRTRGALLQEGASGSQVTVMLRRRLSDGEWMRAKDTGKHQRHRGPSSQGDVTFTPANCLESLGLWWFLESDIAVILRESSSPASVVQGSPEAHKGAEVHGVSRMEIPPPGDSSWGAWDAGGMTPKPL